MKRLPIALCALLVSTAVLAAKPCKETDFKGCLKACEKKKNGPSCRNLGNLFRKGKEGAPQDEAKAYTAMKRACDLGDAAGCGYAGMFSEKGMGTEVNNEAAAKFYTKGCQKKHGGSCLQLGMAYYNGSLVAADKPKATELYGKACQLKEDNGCIKLSLMELQADGIAAAPDKAVKRLTPMCKRKVGRACTELAIGYFRGETGSVEKEKASELFVSGCKYGDARACQLYSENFSGPQEVPASAPQPQP